MTKTLKTVLAICVLSAVSVSMTGCGTMTPELTSSNEAAGEMHYKYSRIMDNNTRSAWNDFERMFFLSHNMRSSPFPTP
ncbi:hypothetical protein JD969_14840 [Planctomycetota bacterium]|nr:hypothetical protein JD969_14840 [Planctomycetota bacterium]